MDERILKKLSEITEEEKKIIEGENIDRSLYSSDRSDFTVKSDYFSGENLIGVRRHTRFAYFPKHRHNYIELIYGISGETLHKVNGKNEARLKEGGILLLGIDAVHEVAPCGENDLAVNFIIRPEFFASTMEIAGYGNTIYDFILNEIRYNGDESFMLFDVSDFPNIKNLMENLLWNFYFSPDDFHSQNLTMGLVFSSLAAKADKAALSDSLTFDGEIAIKTASYIDTHFKDAMLSVLAKSLNLTPVTLSKIIKKNMGSTFKSLLQKKRLTEAEKLIRNTDIPITEIIYAVGYENTNFFYKMFEEKYGCSPKKYRKDKNKARENSVVK
ncbi:MAG: helix-turn-helix domain-containing protein [Clostridia bacterium]|nr:helix-turn-helix domain-containing protein [Clostridia bacterium]